MRRAVIVFATALFALQAAGAQPAPRPPCADADKACAAQALRAHPVRRLDFWSAARQRPVEQRIGAAPPELVQYLGLANTASGFAQRPRAAALDAAFLADARAAIAALPPDVWRLFKDRLMGVYFVDDLGGTGYTDLVLDAQRRPVAGFVVLDAALLRRHTANAWASWKENTPFTPASGYRLEARIEDAGADNRSNAIQYILLHELGHVLSIGAPVHPPWNVAPRDAVDSPAYAYFHLSWRPDRRANRYVSVFDGAFPQRRQVRYYQGATLAGEEMERIYASLADTNFPSLYAATSPGDDFAEAFASYVHVVRMRRPWQITITREGRVLRVFNACWGEARCADKRRLLEQILKPG